MELEGKKIAVLLGPGYEELEFWSVVIRLREAGAEVMVVGDSGGTVFAGKHGCFQEKTEYPADEVDPSELAGIHIPGGWAPDKLRRSEAILGLVRSLNDAGKPIGMICHAGLVGISAGIVSGRKATGSEGIKDDLINAGAEWVNEPALRDGNLVWGRVVADIPAYQRELIAALR
ncbi:MAG: type 1 glutamine amidotransferase [Spirochaetales bacterium]|nr:type 1 glutamine amidotransferase [Spirochaetales bacterium]MCF7937065.1 type 1 glutamine amidotransferase [Spirochaetales bacterium]